MNKKKTAWASEDISHPNTTQAEEAGSGSTSAYENVFLLCLKIARGNGDPEQRKLQLHQEILEPYFSTFSSVLKIFFFSYSKFHLWFRAKTLLSGLES